MSPSDWLDALIASEAWFRPCPRCSDSHAARETQLNFFAVETQRELCSVCAAVPAGEPVLQVRRSSYHDVVKTSDLTPLADVGGVQNYTINGSKVVFLRRRPQPRPPKGAVGASLCTVCSRHLQDVSTFCSLQCKLDAGAGSAPACLRKLAADSGDGSSGSASGAPGTPHHPDSLRQQADSDGSGSEGRCTSSTSSLNARRKGQPCRAHLQ